MHSIERRKFLLMALGAGVANTGCVTQALLRREPGAYTEQIDSFLMTSDGSKLVVLGRQYHYILDAPASLRGLLASSFRSKVQASFADFAVDRSEKLEGRLRVYASKLEPDEHAQALALGFKEYSGSASPLMLDAKLEGTRYSAEKFDQTAAQRSTRFARTYEVKITTPEPSALEYAPRLLLTPVTLAVDGTWLIAALPLVPIMLPFFLMMAYPH